MSHATHIFNQALQYHRKKEYDKAYPLFWQASQQGLADAQVYIGVYYDHGYSVSQDKTAAFNYYMMAARHGNPSGQCSVGTCYLTGNGVTRDYGNAIIWLRRAAQQNSGTACYNLGTCYESGKGTPVDKQEALLWYKKAADLGNPPGITHYNRLKQELDPVKHHRSPPDSGKDPMEKAKRLNREGIELAHKHNQAGAFQKYLQAAQLGFPSSMHNVGACFHMGEGTPKDPEKAFYWISRGASLDHASSIARLGWLHEDGVGTPVNLAEAVRLYEKAAARDNALACNNLGVLYNSGKGVLVDKEKAIELYERAIRLGNGVAKDNLTRLKEKLNWPEPLPIPGSPEEAHALFRQGVALDQQKRFTESYAVYLSSARMGNPNSMYNLGYCYHMGEGTAQNYDLAVYWYRKAVDLGKTEAWNNLGVCYRNGLGVTKDIQRALALYKKGADLGDPQSRKNHDQLYAKLYGPTPKPHEAEPTIPPTEKLTSTPEPQTLDRSAQEELDDLIGLDGVKQNVRELISLVQYQQKRKELGKKTSPVSMHMVFTGNPGTGKTTVARIIARLYHEIGILSKDTIVEVDRSKLVAEYIGQTAKKTSDVIQKALGGVLFIDEAYTLAKPDSDKDYGQEAIETLLKAMEDQRDNLVVIVAGYTAEMHRFITSNPGLKSRFKNFIEFEDYTGPQLTEIFQKMAADEEYTVDSGALNAIGQHFETLYRTRDPKFGNGRVVRNFYQDVLTKVASRSMASGAPGQDRITRADVEAITGSVKHSSGKPPMEQLQELIGLDQVKQEVTELVQLAKYRKLCLDAGLAAPAVSMHMVFTGNPGTGKTTVARLIGRIYHELGLLPTPNCLEVDRSALVGEYIGKTAPKTREVLERAMGGVLFIDEAYTLSKSSADNDYGKEAIDTILKFMEDNRESMVVIVAGYNQEMRQFIGSNPGLQSRFTKQIHFADYSAPELERIFFHFARDYTFTPDARAELTEFFLLMEQRRGSNFGNGREARTFYEDVVTQLAFRIASGDGERADLKRITAEDIKKARSNWEKKNREPVKKPPKIGFI